MSLSHSRYTNSTTTAANIVPVCLSPSWELCIVSMMVCPFRMTFIAFQWILSFPLARVTVTHDYTRDCSQYCQLCDTTIYICIHVTVSVTVDLRIPRQLQLRWYLFIWASYVSYQWQYDSFEWHLAFQWILFILFGESNGDARLHKRL